MKRLLIIGLLFLAAPVFAAETGVSNGSSIPGAGEHTHQYHVDGPAAGIGADIVVLKTASPYAEEVTVEPRYDMNNNEWSVFGVVRVDLVDAIAGK